ncbi:TPA: hypothetical protein NH712_005968 [Pseudomonas aeruginosa]|nr:hypothetical protein [Pseudomonas aeruginosa]HCF0773275.1 hypothetical protein [Pseudomonas aeruginosa]HCL3777348.1 hypothetical protein [Pseudomonas aeruginosa]
MAILVDLLEDGVMTDFLEIREAYTKYKAAQDAYWSDLQKKAWAIYIGFERHLRLEQHKVTVPGEDAQPYVQVGSMDGDRFVRALAPQFSGADGKVEFTISLLVDEHPTSYPKKRILIPASIGKESGRYMVEIKGRSGPISVSIGPDFPVDQLGDLYEMIARDVIASMDPSAFA